MSNKNIKVNFLQKLHQLEIDRGKYMEICKELKQDLFALESIAYSLEQDIYSLIMQLEKECIYKEEGFKNEISQIINKIKILVDTVRD
ncbi:hypothetical protein H1P_620022 [Hyella patelloides LEGE 07179]|uniref:Uncharacterized protein n=1 Tax=Hyella patelloides LEGE 07179 TaxID=945734 RepID=A0A563W1V3_9CYAN|nr:hypothetical protein H1P_620022 [Hyella patelloides LEGE 07179]